MREELCYTTCCHNVSEIHTFIGCTYLRLQDQVNCFYQGEVLEHPEWKVAMDSCQGLRYNAVFDYDLMTPYKEVLCVV